MLRIFVLVILMLLISTGCSNKIPVAYILGHDNPPGVKYGVRGNKEVPGIYKLYAFGIDGVSSGTAFTIQYNKQIYMITAAHVMDDSYAASLRYKGKDVLFQMLEGIKRSDIAVCRVKGDFPGHLEVDKSFHTKFESYEVFGYPGGKSFVKMKCALNPDYGYINSSAFVEKGMSGGPLMRNGKVVGITVAKIKERRGVIYSRHVPISLVRKLIERLP